MTPVEMLVAGAEARSVRDCVDALDAGPKQAIALASSVPGRRPHRSNARPIARTAGHGSRLELPPRRRPRRTCRVPTAALDSTRMLRRVPAGTWTRPEPRAGCASVLAATFASGSSGWPRSGAAPGHAAAALGLARLAQPATWRRCASPVAPGPWWTRVVWRVRAAEHATAAPGAPDRAKAGTRCRSRHLAGRADRRCVLAGLALTRLAPTSRSVYAAATGR